MMVAVGLATGVQAVDSPIPSWAYRCDDDLQILRGNAPALRLQAKVLVVVRPQAQVVTVEVRGDQPVGAGSERYLVQAGDDLQGIAAKMLASRDRWREIAEINPPEVVNQPLRAGSEIRIPQAGVETGQAILTLAGAAPVVMPMPMLSFSIDLKDGVRGPQAGGGLPPALAQELAGMLAQGPAANVLRSNATQSYALRLLSSGGDIALQGEQKNGKLWADLTISGAGEAEIGGREWQLPMTFSLPRQAPFPDSTWSGSAQLLYASIRPGAEGEVAANVDMALGPVTVHRRWTVVPVLHQVPPLVAEPLPLPSQIALGATAAWTRIGALGMLGVQRLPGVCESGLVVWAASVSAESTLAARSAEPAIIASGAGVPALAAPPPAQVPRADLERAIAERDAVTEERNRLQADDGTVWLVEVDAAVSASSAHATTGPTGTTAKGVEFFPALDVRLGLGDRMRWGIGAHALRLSVVSDDAALTWGEGSSGVWLGWRGDRWEASAQVGLSMDSYVARSSNTAVSSSSLAPVFSMTSDVRIASNWSVGARVHFVNGGSGQELTLLPALRYWYRPSLAFQFQASYVKIAHTFDSNTADASSLGVGIGVTVRR